MEDTLREIHEYNEILEEIRKQKFQLMIKESNIKKLIDKANNAILSKIDEHGGVIETENYIIKERKRRELVKLKSGFDVLDVKKSYPQLVKAGKPILNISKCKKVLLEEGVDITDLFDVTLSNRSLLIKPNI